MSEVNLGSRSLMDELTTFDKGWSFDLGHPFLNRFAESFVKAAGIGALQAVSRDVYFSAVDGDYSPEIPGEKKRRFPGLRGEYSNKSLEAMVRNTGKESLQWGLAAGVYAGVTYGLNEARGTNDWKSSVIAGAVSGAAVALTLKDTTHEQLVQCAITGAAISTVAKLLKGIL